MNTALGLGVGFDKEVGIKFAGGFLVQVSLNLLGVLCTRFNVQFILRSHLSLGAQT